MKVTATARGFFNHFREVGAEFEIPDEPSRPLTKTDDAITKAAAGKGKTVPQLFASVWMKPGWASESRPAPVSSPTAPADDDRSNSPI